jgi:hypothetical protein
MNEYSHQPKSGIHSFIHVMSVTIVVHQADSASAAAVAIAASRLPPQWQPNR